MAEHKVNIFDVLADISRKNRNYYTKMSEEEQKAVHPLVLSKWLVGTPNPLQVMLLNEFVNPYIFELHQHKELLMQLLTVVGTGKNQRYTWIKRAKSSTCKSPTIISIIQQIYGYSEKDALDVIPLLSDDDIINYATELGTQNDQIKLLKKELKARNK